MLDEYLAVELSACIAELNLGLLVGTFSRYMRLLPKVTAVTVLVFQPRHDFVELAVYLDP
jgi:hypothetical protein